MPISKPNIGQNAPSAEQNGISNGSVHMHKKQSDVSKNGSHPFSDTSNLTKAPDSHQKLPSSNLDKFVQDSMDDSGVASGSSILSTSSNETLDSKVAESSTDSTVSTESTLNGSSERYRLTSSPSPIRRPIVSNGATSSRSPDLRVRFSDSDFSDTSSNIPASDISSKVDSDDSPTEGATGVNPTLWLGDDQMLLLPGNSRSEETDSNSGTSETKSFEGLLSPNGTSILWDEDTDWILLFDNMIRYADRKQHRTTRSCGCKGKSWIFI